MPRINPLLEERRQQIQGQLERAEATRREAEHLLQDYREQLAGARDEANRIIEEGDGPRTSSARDIQTRAEEEA